MANNVPNFDLMNAGECWKFWNKYRYPSRKEAQELIGDNRKGYVRLAETLANYAFNRANASQCRFSGHMTDALHYEEICDNIYNSLPNDLKW